MQALRENGRHRCCGRVQIVHLSMDRPVVNLKAFGLLQEHLQQNCQVRCLDLGSCGLHTVQNAYKAGVAASKCLKKKETGGSCCWINSFSRQLCRKGRDNEWPHLDYQIQQLKEVCQKQGTGNLEHRPRSPEKATWAIVSVEHVLICCIFVLFKMWDIEKVMLIYFYGVKWEETSSYVFLCNK